MKTIINPDSRVEKHEQLRQHVVEGWHLGQQLCHDFENLTASTLYFFSMHLAASYGGRLTSAHCGYRISAAYQPPKIQQAHRSQKHSRTEVSLIHFIEDNNSTVLRHPFKKGETFQWIYRLNFYFPSENIEASYEQALSLS